MTCPAEIQLTLGSLVLLSPSQDSGGQAPAQLLCAQDLRIWGARGRKDHLNQALLFLPEETSPGHYLPKVAGPEDRKAGCAGASPTPTPALARPSP